MITAQEIVNNGWYLSGIVGRDYETVSGSQSSDGLRILNDILSEIGSTGRYQPYFSQTNQVVTKGSDSFFINNIVDCDSVTFAIGTVIYTLVRKTIKPYFNKPYIQGLESLPYEYYFQREVGGGRIFLYFIPVNDYEFQISGKFMVKSVVNSDDLSLLFDEIYISYLKYSCADKMCQFYNVSVSQNVKLELIRLRKMITRISPNDNTNTFTSILYGRRSVSYGQANLGRGWYPS